MTARALAAVAVVLADVPELWARKLGRRWPSGPIIRAKLQRDLSLTLQGVGLQTRDWFHQVRRDDVLPLFGPGAAAHLATLSAAALDRAGWRESRTPSPDCPIWCDEVPGILTEIAAMWKASGVLWTGRIPAELLNADLPGHATVGADLSITVRQGTPAGALIAAANLYESLPIFIGLPAAAAHLRDLDRRAAAQAHFADARALKDGT